MYEFLDFQTGDVMSTEVVSIGPDASLGEAEALFERHGINGLPVLDADGHLCGLLTKLDLLGAFEVQDGQVFAPYQEIMRRPVRSAMSRDVVTVTPRTPLTRILTKLVDTRAKSLPVLDPDQKLVGVVAREDVMGALRRAVAGERPGGD